LEPLADCKDISLVEFVSQLAFSNKAENLLIELVEGSLSDLTLLRAIRVLVMGISTECRRPSAIFQNQIVGVTNEFLQDTPKSNFRIHHHRELHSHPERTKKPNILDKKQISISYLFIKE
jgi:hypothetical protein